ncbi:hypothetical protein A9Q81_22495 [Gammaproteobacteria bacterium 42_54_T18]|nr:hypothetical protein A9Q81_22495 [Gammaproteobacteria bacterium 42_54_T18]
MSKFIATIQQGHNADDLREHLAKGLQNIAIESFGKEAANSEVKWKVIPKSFAWTAGKPSRTSALICVVPEDLEFETRAKFMAQINDYWVGQTGANPNELLIFTLNNGY